MSSLRKLRVGRRWRNWLSNSWFIPPRQITEWKQQLLARATGVFGGTTPPSEAPDLETLHAKIGQLTLENGFLEGALIKAGWHRNRRYQHK